MKFEYAKRLESFQAGIFAILNEKKEAYNFSGCLGFFVRFFVLAK